MGSPIGVGVQTESGSISNLAISAGEQFCFRVRSNNTGAASVLDVYDFSYEITEITQTSGITNNTTQTIGAYDVEYSVTDCTGSSATCSFTVTVADVTAPVLICPGNSTFQLGLEECDTVVTFFLLFLR